MNRKSLIMVILTVISLIFLSGLVIVTVNRVRGSVSQEVNNGADTDPITDIVDHGSDDTYNPSDESTSNDIGGDSDSTDTDLSMDEPFVPATEMDLDPTSITVLVNKEFSLPKDYKPDNMVVPNIHFDLTYYDERTLMRAEAASAIELLFSAAKEEGYELSGVSGYRSFARQKKIFTTNILTKGKEHTLKYSAAPGTSEHQTGLAMDVSCKSLGYDLSSKFADMPEGIWLAENAHRFGFIIRYQKGKSDITGYAYEPWHIRYVGKGLAKYLYENDLTLEEYYNYVPSPDFDFEAKYAALINITPAPVPTYIPTSGEGVLIGENGEIIEGDLDLIPSLSPTPTILPSDSPTPSPKPKPTKKPGKLPDDVLLTPTPTTWPSLEPEEDFPEEDFPDENEDINEEQDNDLGDSENFPELSPTPIPQPTSILE